MRDLTPVLALLGILAMGTVEAREPEPVDRYHVTVSIKGPSPSSAERTQHLPARTIRRASGTIVGTQGVVVTAAHVARSNANTARVVDHQGSSYQAEVARVIHDSDVAILRITGSWRFQLRAAPTHVNPPPGTRATAVGIEGRGAVATRTGAVRVPRAAQRFQFGAFGFRNPIVLDMRVAPGFSGGPVFDEQGQWLGMVAGYALEKSDDGTPANSGEAYVIPAERILGFIESNRDQGQ